MDIFNILANIVQLAEQRPVGGAIWVRISLFAHYNCIKSSYLFNSLLRRWSWVRVPPGDEPVAQLAEHLKNTLRNFSLNTSISSTRGRCHCKMAMTGGLRTWIDKETLRGIFLIFSNLGVLFYFDSPCWYWCCHGNIQDRLRHWEFSYTLKPCGCQKTPHAESI